jgi:hypothetical protein
MRARRNTLLLLALLLLLTGCTTTDVSSFERMLEDLGIDADVQQMLQDAGVELKDLEALVNSEVDDILKEIRGFRLEIPTGLRVCIIIAGLVLVLAGKKLYRAAIAATGFALGLAAGTTVLGFIDELPHPVVLVVSAGVGLVGAGLALSLHDMAALIIGSALGGFLAFSLLMAYAVELSPAFILVVLFVGAVSGIGLLLIARRLTILMGALLGAALVSVGMVENLSLLIIVPVALVSVGVQLLATQFGKRRPGRRHAVPAPAGLQYAPPPQPAGYYNYAGSPQPRHAPPPASYQQPPQQPFSAWGETPQPTVPPPASLTRQCQAGVETTHINTDVFRIGSDPSLCDLTMPGLAASHATITTFPNGYYLESHAGPYDTLVNGQPVQTIYLQHSDMIRMGAYEFHFNIQQPTPWGHSEA